MNTLCPQNILSANGAHKESKKGGLSKLLGALAARKPCVMVAGGIMVLGSIHLLRKGRKWICKRISPVHRKGEEEAPRSDSTTQTDPLDEYFISEHHSLHHRNARVNQEPGGKHGAGKSCTEASEMAFGLYPHPRKFRISRCNSVKESSGGTLIKRDAPDRDMDCACHCSTIQNEQKFVTKVTQGPHPLCQLSIVMSLLALQKEGICENNTPYGICDRHESVRGQGQMKGTEYECIFVPGKKQLIPDAGKPNTSIRTEKMTSRDNGKPAKDYKTFEHTACLKPLAFSPLNLTKGPVPAEYHPNPLKRQVPARAEKTSPLRAEAEPFIPGSNRTFSFPKSSLLRADEKPFIPKSNRASTLRKSSSLRADAKPFIPKVNKASIMPKPSSLRANAKPFIIGLNTISGVSNPTPAAEARIKPASTNAHKGGNFVSARKDRGGRRNYGSRSERTRDNGWRQRQRGGRGGRRRNGAPRREHVDLDKARQVASLHDCRSNIR